MIHRDKSAGTTAPVTGGVYDITPNQEQEEIRRRSTSEITTETSEHEADCMQGRLVPAGKVLICEDDTIFM
jgi:hypothetical protein